MDREFVERRNGGFYVAASRVPLDFIVLEFQQGESPEAIRSDFPTLSLEHFYLGHKDEVEKAMAERAREEDAYSAAEVRAHAASTAGTAKLTMCQIPRCWPSLPSRIAFLSRPILRPCRDNLVSSFSEVALALACFS